MNEWTVFGVYPDKGDVWIQRIQYVLDAQTAIKAAVEGADDPDQLIVIGAVAGSHVITTPGEDSWTAAYAVDLQKGEDDGDEES